jgi:glucosamine kinase
VEQVPLILGVDGGGTNCRVRLSEFSGRVLAEGWAGPANLRLGVAQSFSAIFAAIEQCLDQAAMQQHDLARVVACLALAGASEPSHLRAAQDRCYPFKKTIITTDAHAACVGAHRCKDGGIIIAGTGTVAWAIVRGQTYRIGGWGLPISDEGSGAWLGGEVLRHVLWARDGRIGWTPLLRSVFADFANNPHAIVDWVVTAKPRDFGSFAPAIVDHAAKGDPVAIGLMRIAGSHIDALATRLFAVGADRLSLVGGLGPAVLPWLGPGTASHLVEPDGDALEGALRLARAAAESAAFVAA